MDTIKVENTYKTPYLGINWRDTKHRLPIQPKDTVSFCDLRNCSLEKLDLSMVEFFGCRLNGTLFKGANLQKTQFISCFSSDDCAPTDFRDVIHEDVSVVYSHLHYQADEFLTDSHYFGDDFWMGISPESRWPDVVAAAATETLSDRNDVRYNAAAKLGDLDNPVVAPILACLLADDEWDVRSIALEALGNLRHQEFPQGDNILLEWMFLRLGDRHSIVRHTARNLVEILSPPNHVLLASINRMMSPESEEKIAGVLAAIELCRLDEQYSSLLEPQTIEGLLSDESLDVRQECSSLREILDGDC
ncbi:HEAT repeat domain-containing protein [Microcoleus sp. N9_B2]|uniref:HEAT repeat domain-containing protein n=1 Tax=unclassified Microcoleus TaxID=2642155 RepID=UPI002FD11CD3